MSPDDPDDPADAGKPASGTPPLRGEFSTGEGAEASTHEDRISPRIEVALDAGARQSGASYVSVEVMDLSTHGFRMETHLNLQKGADLWLRLPGLEARHAKVVWVRGILVGCAFEEPLHDAVLDLIVGKSRES